MSGAVAEEAEQVFLCVRIATRLFLVPVGAIESIVSARRLFDAPEKEGMRVYRLCDLLDIPAEAEEAYALMLRLPQGRFGVLVEEAMNPMTVRADEMLRMPPEVIGAEKTFLTGIWLAEDRRPVFLLDMEVLLQGAVLRREEGEGIAHTR